LNRDLLDELSNACRELEESVDLGIVVFANLLSSILNRFGLKYDATNEDIYKVLEVLGWEVE
jgi:hypothetical protein